MSAGLDYRLSPPPLVTNCVPATRSCATCSTLLPVHSSSQPSATPRRQESHSPVHLESQLHRLAVAVTPDYRFNWVHQVQCMATTPSSVYGYLSCVRYLLPLVSTMRAPSAAARMYHANACCCSYLLYLCYLPYVCCLLLLVSTVYVPSASARIYHACDICCCSYLPYVCCLLQLVPNVYVLSAASRIYCIILSIQFMNYFEYSIVWQLM